MWLALPGCLKQFDELAIIFAKNSGKDRMKVIRQMEEMISKQQDEEEAEVGKKYLKIMKNVEAKGETFLGQEVSRLEKLLKSNKKISIAKKQSLQKNLNILKSFSSSLPISDVKDEL